MRIGNGQRVKVADEAYRREGEHGRSEGHESPPDVPPRAVEYRTHTSEKQNEDDSWNRNKRRS